jgi:putative two-component system response regulator
MGESKNYSILIVDDVLENIQVAMNILEENNYDFAYAKSGEEALKILKSNTFTLILLDIMMPGIDGYEVCKIIKEDPRLMDIPVIFLTAKADIDSLKKGFEVGGVDYITKPFHPEELLARVQTHIELYVAKKLLQKHNISMQIKLEKAQKRLYTELEMNQKEMLFMLSEIIESISDETGRHIHRVAELSRLLAYYHPSLNSDDVEIIYHTSAMHDIGKIFIPNEILHKPGRLTKEEFEIMKTHTTKAYQFFENEKIHSVASRKFIKASTVIAHEHHEKWDGSGYPRGLKGEEIHIYARIVSLVDVLDALTHKRSYKDAWEIEKAVNYIIERKGKDFDPFIVEIFQEHLDEFLVLVQS